MAVSPDFRDYVLDLLEPLGRVRARAMFGELLSKVVYGFVMRRRDPGVLH